MNIKKKIALATAAALATFGISAASAAPLSVSVNSVPNVTTSAAPSTVLVPSTNVIDAGHTVSISATADNGTSVTFTASPTVKLVSALNTVDAPKTVTSGTSSVSVVSNGSAVYAYAYTTSTAVGSITVTNGAYSTIVYVQGIAGLAANISLSVPSATAVGTVPTISASATDAFGNPVGSESISVTLIGSTFTGGAITSSIVTSSATSAPGVSPVTVLGTGTATLTTAVAGTVTVVATDASIGVAPAGLPDSVKSAIATFVVSDLSATITQLKAQLLIEKAGRTADKAAADKALADEKAAHAADLAKASSDAVSVKASSDAAFAKANSKYAALVKLYNAKAKKYKFAATK
jgi:hypothetical protein